MHTSVWLGALLMVLASIGTGPSAPRVLACEETDPVEAASQVKARHEDALFAVPGVVGTGIGRASDTGEVVIEVYVARLTDQVRQQLPSQLEGIRVQIVETGEFRPR